MYSIDLMYTKPHQPPLTGNTFEQELPVAISSLEGPQEMEPESSTPYSTELVPVLVG